AARAHSPHPSALQELKTALAGASLTGLVVLQDFVVGGGAGRSAATDALADLDVPVVSAIRLADRGSAQWALSNDGIPWHKVHNQVAMPELQGQSQPHVIATDGRPAFDTRTGLRLVRPEALPLEIERLAQRFVRWSRLRELDNADKRIALIYYNHPPGRHNIGADNLDVPATLLQLLRSLAEDGYDVGTLPESSEELLDRLQATGVNLPEDRGALRKQHAKGRVLPGDRYARYFEGLPAATREEVQSGPLGRLRSVVLQALRAGELELARMHLDAALGDARHLLEGVEHPARTRALSLIEQLTQAYGKRIAGDDSAEEDINALTQALTRTGIEGLRGWGFPPGDVMSWSGDLLIPGVAFGNVWLGPQPPRGWEVNEELLHANLSVPPHHQYLGWYHWIREVWEADALVHIGRHSTAEFLPGKRTGLGAEDTPQLVIGDLPNLYIYIVDGVGEGIQAKRRGQAVIVDHLTPALSTTPLYDELLELRQLVETYEAAEAAPNDQRQTQAVERIRSLIAELDLEAELSASMAGELEVRGIAFVEVDDALLVHEVGHYLTHLQEEFMPLGLHVFGSPWSEERIDTMLRSMGAGESPPAEVRRRLEISPRSELEALLAGLQGRYVAPGKGNDPVRTASVLPTGRNFHALGGEQTPTRLAWELGETLAQQALASGASREDDAEAVVLWASDTVRDEGAMIAFGLALLGVRPVWNSRGIVRGIERVEGPLEDQGRRDVTFVTSGLFRDLYPNQLVLLDRAWLLALDASSRTIADEHPELKPALERALSRLDHRAPGREALSQNQIAAHWVRDTAANRGAGVALPEAGLQASLRVFGNARGGYGAGLNRLAERSGAWDTRRELADVWMRRMGHAYGADIDGAPAHAAFRMRLEHTERTYLGRASNLYGLLDNNDAFDYLGGLSLAVEEVRGEPPQGHIISHADASDPRMAPLATELLGELRGRELNPEWIKALMQHGYAGARTMGNEFFENLWGWQVTNPRIVEPWVWQEVKEVYLDDRHELGLDTFLEEGNNVHVKTNMIAILLVGVEKGFYAPDEEVLKTLAETFARLVAEHGLPGSGHTRPDHPIMDLVRSQIGEDAQMLLDAVLAAAQREDREAARDPSAIAEVEIEEAPHAIRPALWAAGLALLALLLFGVWRGSRRL
ncbi:MAG: cobaltochelatase subunit CobN, partial [Myxococcota bacterium]